MDGGGAAGSGDRDSVDGRVVAKRREHGMYPSELEKWRVEAMSALADPGEARATPKQIRRDRRRIKELERQVKRKDKALAESAALLVLSKKLSAVFQEDEDE